MATVESFRMTHKRMLNTRHLMLSSQLLGNHDSYPSNPTIKGLSNKCALNSKPLTWTNSPLANAQHSYIPATIPPKKERSQKKLIERKKWMCWYVCFIAKSNQPPPPPKTWFSTSKSSSPCSRWPPTMTWPVGWVNPQLTGSTRWRKPMGTKHPKIYAFFLPTTKWG